MPGAVVYTEDKTVGVSTNEFGYYVLRLKPGTYRIKCAFPGYVTEEYDLELKGRMQHDFVLKEDRKVLDAATVFSKSRREEITLPQMGKQSVDGALARKLPALMGESDIIRVIQMMPGVQSPSEGSTGFSVRGGGVDQNLILMDGAPIYSSGHFLGFLSMFNGDAIRNAELFKGDFPARYGGRMSSVLDINTVDGSLDSFSGNASIGLITSRIFVQGPVARQKAGFMISARRTYMDVFLPLVARKVAKGTRMYFYDLNAKFHWIAGPDDRLYLSLFGGDDIFGMSMKEFELDKMMFDIGNKTASLRWNHTYSPSVFSNTTAYATDFSSLVGCEMLDMSFDYRQRIREYGLKNSTTWYLNGNNTMEFGAAFSTYGLTPGETIPGEGSIVQSVVMPHSQAIQPALYIQNEQKAGPVTMRYGLRLTSFTTMGKTQQRYFDSETHELVDSVDFAKGKPICTYIGLDPRFSLSWSVTPDMSVKASYTRTHQFIQQAIISITGSPMDSWISASPNVKPQISDQFSAGLNALMMDSALEASAELFYKNNKNTLDFKDNPGFVINDINREGLLRFGRSYAFGAEMMLKYDFDRLSGWLSYTWSRSMNKIPEINGGKAYRSPLNHEHAINFVSTYDISERLSASLDWVFYSGAPTTYPVGRFKYFDRYILIYSGRNEDRMPDYHRMDISLNWKTKARLEDRRWSGEWSFSAYNAYSRHNAWSIAFGYNREDQTSEVRKVYLFTIIPSVSYNIQF